VLISQGTDKMNASNNRVNQSMETKFNLKKKKSLTSWMGKLHLFVKINIAHLSLEKEGF